jgi:hypothetical protein
MNDLTSKNSSSLLAAGGAGFLALAAIFLVRDLALPPETLLGVVALVASVAAILGRPRRWRWVAPGVLLAVIAAVVLQERRASGAPSDAAVPLAWYAAGTAFLVASAALYFHFLTLGFADESLARRLIPTIGWLAIGLALLIAARRPTSPPGRVGIGFVAVAAIKALAYDSTHLQGPLRITVFAAVGVLLLAGARLISDRERAA